jgi:hypothetical protein
MKLRCSKQVLIKTGFLFIALSLSSSPLCILQASEEPATNNPPTVLTQPSPLPKPWHDKIDVEWGGHLKVTGAASWPDDNSFFQPVGTGTYTDGSADLRLKNKTFLSTWGILEIHYENIVSGGDTRQKARDLVRFFPGVINTDLMPGKAIEDDRRLMDLTKVMNDDDDHTWYHRLDRLSLTLQPAWGTVSIGRQALTWGNGLIFNPMDLFNPFSPTDIDRDYKIGDDMALVQFSAGRLGDLQFLYVPRRNTSNHNLEFDQSSLAGKLHTAINTTEFDIMAARHYRDTVVGIGSTGYLWDTAWRLDATYTFLNDNSRQDGFLSLVANMDYSWTWMGRNFYGLLEFYYSGLGEDTYSTALVDPDISKRLNRGEIFVLGRTYLSGEIQMELHPLLNLYLTVINNTADPSGIVQPRAIWDVAENIQFTAGADLFYGKSGTEFGGFKLMGTPFLYAPSNSVFFWITCFF